MIGRRLKLPLACYWYLVEGRLECRWLVAVDLQGSIAAKVNAGDNSVELSNPRRRVIRWLGISSIEIVSHRIQAAHDLTLLALDKAVGQWLIDRAGVYWWDNEGIRINQQSAGKSSMITSIDQTAINLVCDLIGAGIGFERQSRQRMAGLRTNTLVAIGAASFVIFASLFRGRRTQPVLRASGFGKRFLGAEIIFREGLQVSALNTAATLWCSVVVGLLAASWHPLHAVLAGSFVILVNLLLRRLVRLVNQQPIAQTESGSRWTLT